ncbi:MAG TPA: 50S ribosomal protein L21 [Gaiellaceae bacterium]|nr:50S ribosomal protein L21 [Gaiellaceae bacterium]HSJ92477.1 50S ribosomal protein L21 [Gaiellaceae bacterium]
MTYAIIGIGGKQYRVREGEWLLVDRVATEEGKTFKPDVLLLGGDGEPKLGDDLKGAEVTAVVTGHVLGEKIVVGKHRQRTGYRRRKGHRSRLSRIEIQSIGAKSARKAPAKKAEGEKKETKAKSSTAAKKPAAKKKTEGKS